MNQLEYVLLNISRIVLWQGRQVESSQFGALGDREVRWEDRVFWFLVEIGVFFLGSQLGLQDGQEYIGVLLIWLFLFRGLGCFRERNFLECSFFGCLVFGGFVRIVFGFGFRLLLFRLVGVCYYGYVRYFFKVYKIVFLE